MKRIVIAAALAVGLSACGGGGGGAVTGTGPAFTPTIGTATTDVLSLLKNASSSSGTLVLDLSLTSPTAVTPGPAALSTDLTFDSTWMTFSGFTADANQATGGGTTVAAVDQGDPNRVVIAATKVQSGSIGKLTFTTSGSGNNATMAFKSSTYVDGNGQAVPSVLISGNGGTATN